MKILAALAVAPGEPFELTDAELDAPRADEILIKVAAVGLCHTDLSVRDQMIPVPLPAVLGHEGAGTVTQVGSDVTGVQPGDKVLLSFTSCGECANCGEGLPSYCDSFIPLNFSGSRVDGSHTIHSEHTPVSANFFGQSSFASHALATERNVIKLPDHTDLSLVAPLGCGIQTGAGTVMNVLACPPGSTIAVFGGGAVGLSAVMAAVVQGCKTIIVVEPFERRRELAMELGATHVIDPGSVDTVAGIRDVLPAGLDFALDTTANSSALESAIQALGVRGKLALVGVPADPGRTFSVNTLQTVSIGATICGTVEGDSDPKAFIPQLLELHAAGRFPFERLITKYPFASINQAIHDHHDGLCVKAVLTL